MVDLLSDLHIGCRIKFKYQNAHNSKHQITLDLKFSINAGKFKSNTTNGIIRDAMKFSINASKFNQIPQTGR